MDDDEYDDIPDEDLMLAFDQVQEPVLKSAKDSGNTSRSFRRPLETQPLGLTAASVCPHDYSTASLT